MSLVTHTYTIPAKDRGAAERHRRAADTLLGLLVRHPRTPHLFADLRKRTGLNQAATALRRALARGAGRPTLARIERALVETLQHERMQFMGAMARHVADALRGQQLELAGGLLNIFLGDVAERAYGKAPVRRSRIAFNSTVPAPQLIFSPPLEMTADERNREWRQAGIAYEGELAAHRRTFRQVPGALPRPGRRPKDDVTEQYATWYYRHVAEDVHVHQLAEEYHHSAKHLQDHGQHVSDHSLILYGIRETARLFNLPLSRRKNSH